MSVEKKQKCQNIRKKVNSIQKPLSDESFYGAKLQKNDIESI